VKGSRISAQPVRVLLEIRGREADPVGVADLDEVEVPVVGLLVDVEERGGAGEVDVAGSGLSEFE
jgi:hypothetical protein